MSHEHFLKLLSVTGFAIFLLLPLAVALPQQVDYPELGTNDTTYVLGDGIFNENFDNNELITTTVIIDDTTPKAPLVKDLDKDGVKEIILLDLNTIQVYQNTTLQIAAAHTLTAATTSTFSNVILFDIDGDSKDEIIVVAETEVELYILDYDFGIITEKTPAGGFNLQTAFNETPIEGSAEFMLGCKEPERCFMVFSEDTTSGVSSGIDDMQMYISHFNSTDVSAQTLFVVDNATGFNVLCMPKIRHMFVGNIDSDGDTDIVFSAMESNNAASANEIGHVYFVDYFEGNNSFLLKFKVDESEVGNIANNPTQPRSYHCKGTGFEDCQTDTSRECLMQDFVTSPLVSNTDPTASNQEITVGFGVDEDEFKVYMYDSVTGALVDDFPETEESEGLIISNPFLANTFDDSDVSDVCVLGYNGDPIGLDPPSLVLTCGSRTDPNGFGLFNLQTIEFRTEVTSQFNLTQEQGFENNLAHTVEMDGSNSVTEVSSAYGILEPDTSGVTCSTTNNCDLNVIYPITEGDGAVIMVDYEEAETLSQNSDFIVAKNGNLFYLNDGQVDEALSALEFQTNPCIDAVWKQNTSVQVLLTGTDPESSTVTLTAILYEGDPNEQSSTVNTTSGVTAPFNFNANATGSGALVMRGSDLINPTDIIEIERPFTVSSSGVEFGDCSTNGTSAVADTPTNATLTSTGFVSEASTQGLQQATNDLSDITNLGGATLWLIGMLIAALLVMTGTASLSLQAFGKIDGAAMLGGLIAALLVDGIIFIIGAVNGVFSPGIVFMVVLLFVVVIAAIGSRFVFSATPSGGGAR